jgi:hypothetical protein
MSSPQFLLRHGKLHAAIVGLTQGIVYLWGLSKNGVRQEVNWHILMLKVLKISIFAIFSFLIWLEAFFNL